MTARHHDYCNTCGHFECRCADRAEGYECSTCGSTPTWAELQRGRCQGCAEDRRSARKGQDRSTDRPTGDQP